MTASEHVSAEDVRQLYDGMASWWKWTSVPDTIIGITRLRRKLFNGAQGDVLDVACGTGENFRYLRDAASVVAVDLSPAMVAEARKRSDRMGLMVRIEEADVVALPFEDDSFDVVVTAMSSCTFPDHVAAFREMERVVKPGGEIRLLEHGRSDIGWIARRQDRGVHKKLESGNCRNNRDPLAEIEAAGLRVVSHRRSHLGIVSRFVIEAA